MKEILKSINIAKPITEPNIVIMEDDFTPKDWYESEAMKEEAEKVKADEEKAKADKEQAKIAKEKAKIEKKAAKVEKKAVKKEKSSKKGIFKRKNKKAAASSN